MKTERADSAVGVRKYHGLQILRIAAAFMVLLTHSSFYASERLDRHFTVWERGATGVSIFFVLSGFVMVYSSSKLWGDPTGWKVFAERRIVRIVPMYWIATTVKVVAILLTTGYVLHAELSPVNTFASYFFLPAYNTEGHIGPILGVGWTLNFEMLFYFLFTLALFFRVNVYRFVGGILAVLALGGLFRQPGWPAVSFYLDTIVLEFFYGMIIARICLASKHIPKYLAIPLLILGFLGLLGPWPPLLQLHGLHYGLAAALIVFSMASLEDSLTRIPRFVIYLADASYVIYLFHPFIAPAVPAALLKLHLFYPWLSVFCSVALGLGGGCLIYSFVDAPITKWLRNHLVLGGKKAIRPVATV
jgi:exopolysaccharide production protein ExoZ